MPPVNWDSFAELPGSAEKNFEMLCRSLVRRHYARHGDFRALAAQPGVEFHLRLQKPCQLGDPGRWYGWQCRWYDLPGGRALGTTRRKKIEKAISMTEAVLPGLTDWVLWTRRTLTAGDQSWFYGLKTLMKLHLWKAAEIEDHLIGDAEILRSTYFGELILTPETLAGLHNEAVAPIRRRWNPDVHQTIDAERTLRRILAEPGTWEDLQSFSRQLLAEAKAVDGDLGGVPQSLAKPVLEVASSARAVASALGDGYAALEQGDLDMLRQQIMEHPEAKGRKHASLPRYLRAYRHRAALSVTNALADTRRACSILDEIKANPNKRLVAVLAEVGCGKTELAAQITSALGVRPHGILLHGRNLGAGHSLDDLARSVVIHGVPVASMEALIAAVDAAGQRAHRRLPVVIDGLNEAEDPRKWKSMLDVLDQTLLRYPYVLVVCMLREAFADEALPAEVFRLHISGFAQDTGQAIRRYFDYFRINAYDALLPLELLRHPLTLRLFCEVNNPNREPLAGVEAMTNSLSSLFDRYLERVSESVEDLAPIAWRYYQQDVRAALDEIGLALWQARTRSLEFDALRNQLRDDIRPWNLSIVRALEQEGVLLRIRERGSKVDQITVVYDALAGHLVADAVIAKFGRTGLEKWLTEATTIKALFGPSHEQHPLAQDILGALVGLFPWRLRRKQLWPLLQEPMRAVALMGAADLEAANLDAETVRELAALVVQPPTGPRDLLDRLMNTRGSPTHPLNSNFLDAILRPMSVAQRDSRWTEWVRRCGAKLVKDLETLERHWHTLGQRSQIDRLRAQWVMWTLSSTVPKVRDQAARTLYWFGRGEPAALFSLTLNALGINDPYVSERLLAVSYGVAMAHQLPNGEFEKPIGDFLVGLLNALTGPGATHPTNNWLARLYVQGCFTFALAYYPSAVPNGLDVDGKVPFAMGPAIDGIAPGDSRAAEVDHALNMHFDDDTLGEFVGFRRGFGGENRKEHLIVAHLRGTLWTLGWRETGLGTIDKHIRSSDYRRHSGEAQRYAYKYAWIGSYGYSGILDYYRRTRGDGRPPDVQIDPSFPEPPKPAPINISEWARPTPVKDVSWIRQGIVAVPDELFYLPAIGPYCGPWIAAKGSLSARTKVPDRGVFGLLIALLVDAADADRLIDALTNKDYPGNDWVPRVPEDHYTFAGEIPWSPDFARGIEDDEGGRRYRDVITPADGPPIEVEILAHHFGWESYHSELNQGGGAYVPSKSFSSTLDLRGVPQSFDQTSQDGTRAAISLGAPTGFGGHLLYLREDLLLRYAAGRRLVWFIWGERNLYGYSHSRPDWLVKAHRERAHIWRRLVRGE
ncbi:MAG: hypothetical protein JJE04_13620, partial [Acidobacteriia bacterium]|nr:hypothetical protein [Terriglobia bacterium]